MNKFFKIFTVAGITSVLALSVVLPACKKDVGENSGYTLQDIYEYPAVSAPYEEESKAVIEAYKAVADAHIEDGEVNYENEEVQAAAIKAAAELYAYACYNEEYVDRYVYFSNQTGTTSYGGLGESTATKQDYKLIIHADEDTVGYKYHYTIKYVDKISSALEIFKSMFEDASLRFVEDSVADDNAAKLYRFSGNNVHYDDDGYLTCSWAVGSDWGVKDPSVAKRSEKLTIEEIAQDIKDLAVSDDPGDAVVHGNINILAENIVNWAMIMDSETNGYPCYLVVMSIDTDVANADKYSMSMLRNANSSSNCVWDDDSLFIIYQIWDNGLFHFYSISEQWTGDILVAKNGTASSSVDVYYSYSDRDTGITDKLDMLDNARKNYGY